MAGSEEQNPKEDRGAIPPDSESSAEKDPEEIHMWASLCHFSALLGLIWWMPTGLGFWVPFGQLLAPLVVWLYKRSDSPFIDAAGRESLSFQILMTIIGIICAHLFWFWVPFPLVHIFVTVDAFLVIAAGVQVSKGEVFHYPVLPFRLLR